MITIKNLFRKIIIACLSVILVLSNASYVFASDQQITQMSISPRASDFIASYAIWMKNAGNGKLNVSSMVDTIGDVDKLEIQSLELQELVGIKWTTVATWSEKCTNTYFAGVSGSYQGTIGSCYRVKGVYYAERAGKSETKTMTTDSGYAVK